MENTLIQRANIAAYVCKELGGNITQRNGLLTFKFSRKSVGDETLYQVLGAFMQLGLVEGDQQDLIRFSNRFLEAVESEKQVIGTNTSVELGSVDSDQCIINIILPNHLAPTILQ